MALSYPQTCFSGLLGINGLCTVPTVTPRMYLDEIPGLTLDNLSKLAIIDNPTGEAVGTRIIESASRFVSADVVSIYDAAYKVVPSLVNGCSACSFSTTTSSGSGLGTMVKNQNTSRMARLNIPSLIAKLNATGNYTVVLNDDNGNVMTFAADFVAGQEIEFKNVNYSTRQKTVRIYTQEVVSMYRLTCPSGGGCGCSGKVAHKGDLVFTGTSGGAEQSQSYGFLPCAYIGCSEDDVLCTIAQQAPVMVAQAMLYKAGELYFQMIRNDKSRNNAIKSTDPEALYRDERYWGKQYTNKLQGVGIRGLKDVVGEIMKQTTDACIVCDSKFKTAWATG